MGKKADGEHSVKHGNHDGKCKPLLLLLFLMSQRASQHTPADMTAVVTIASAITIISYHEEKRRKPLTTAEIQNRTEQRIRPKFSLFLQKQIPLPLSLSPRSSSACHTIAHSHPHDSQGHTDTERNSLNEISERAEERMHAEVTRERERESRAELKSELDCVHVPAYVYVLRCRRKQRHADREHVNMT